MRKNKKTSLKKYLTGTAVTDYIEDPSTVLAQNNIDITKAKYKAESNPWLQGMQMVGNLGMSYGLNKMGAGQFTEPIKNIANTQFATGGTIDIDPKNKGKFTTAAKKAGMGVQEYASKILANKDKYSPLLVKRANFAKNATKFKHALGGDVGGVPVEVEGQEVMETPDGTVAEFNGPSHENGGIPINLPEGTEIFSKRIEKMGESMAERKIKRERKVSKLEKMLESKPKDTLTRKTLNKVIENNKKEEEADMQLQEDMTRLMEDSINMACGGSVRKKMLNGTGQYGVQYDPNLLSETSMNEDPMMAKTLVDAIDVPMPASTDQSQMSFADRLSNLDISNLPTAGDVTGLAGTAISTFSPYLNTLKNRASDTPNVNYFKDYGRRSLETIQDTKQYIGQERDKALQDLQLSRNAAVNRNRGSARGINTMRAFDLAADQAANKASGDIYSNFADQMMGIMGQEAGVQSQQDQVVMGGERARDISDRMDRDNFYTQRGASLSNIGTGLQSAGRSLNQMYGRGENAAMIEELKQMGFDQNQITNLMQLFLKSQG